MPYSNFDVFTRSSATAVLDIVTTPLVASGSLTMSIITAGATLNVVAKDAEPVYVKGYTAGRLRCLFKVLSAGGVASPGNFGFTFMHSGRNNLTQFVAGYPSFYIVKITFNSAGAISVINLFKVIADTVGGGAGGTTTLLATVTITSIPIDTLCCFEVDWFYEPVGIGGTYIQLSAGSAIDFSDLAPKFIYVDITSPLTTSIGEGIYASDNSGVGSRKIQADMLSLYELTIP